MAFFQSQGFCFIAGGTIVLTFDPVIDEVFQLTLLLNSNGATVTITDSNAVQTILSNDDVRGNNGDDFELVPVDIEILNVVAIEIVFEDAGALCNVEICVDDESTSSPSSELTSGPTSGPTSAPTSGPTSEPTCAPTSGPTSAPTRKFDAFVVDFFFDDN